MFLNNILNLENINLTLHNITLNESKATHPDFSQQYGQTLQNYPGFQKLKPRTSWGLTHQALGQPTRKETDPLRPPVPLKCLFFLFQKATTEILSENYIIYQINYITSTTVMKYYTDTVDTSKEIYYNENIIKMYTFP